MSAMPEAAWAAAVVLAPQLTAKMPKSAQITVRP